MMRMRAIQRPRLLPLVNSSLGCAMVIRFACQILFPFPIQYVFNNVDTSNRENHEVSCIHIGLCRFKYSVVFLYHSY